MCEALCDTLLSNSLDGMHASPSIERHSEIRGGGRREGGCREGQQLEEEEWVEKEVDDWEEKIRWGEVECEV